MSSSELTDSNSAPDGTALPALVGTPGEPLWHRRPNPGPTDRPVAADRSLTESQSLDPGDSDFSSSAAPKKVGRTTKNRVSSCNHEPVLAHTGYEMP